MTANAQWARRVVADRHAGFGADSRPRPFWYVDVAGCLLLIGDCHRRPPVKHRVLVSRPASPGDWVCLAGALDQLTGRHPLFHRALDTVAAHLDCLRELRPMSRYRLDVLTPTDIRILRSGVIQRVEPAAYRSATPPTTCGPASHPPALGPAYGAPDHLSTHGHPALGLRRGDETPSRAPVGVAEHAVTRTACGRAEPGPTLHESPGSVLW